MTAAPGFWGQSMGRFRRLRGARAGLTWIGTLLLCAAAAPWVAAGHPVLVVGPDGWRCPVLEAFHQADFLWSGLFLALLACGSLRRLSRPRLGALVGLTLLVTSAVLGAGAEPANLKVEDWDQVASREDTTLLWPLIRHGATDIDKGAVLVGVGAPGHVLGTDVAGRDVAARELGVAPLEQRRGRGQRAVQRRQRLERHRRLARVRAAPASAIPAAAVSVLAAQYAKYVAQHRGVCVVPDAGRGAQHRHGRQRGSKQCRAPPAE